MIGAITNALSSPTLASIAQNTAASVSIETGLKAVGRPSFILADKNIKPDSSVENQPQDSENINDSSNLDSLNSPDSNITNKETIN